MKSLDSLSDFVLKCFSFCALLFYTLYSDLQGEDLKRAFPDPSFLAAKSLYQFVRKVDNAIHRVNRYPADSVACFVNTYSRDSDLSG